MAPGDAGEPDAVRTRRSHIRPRGPNQRAYIASIRQNDLCFGIGPAGTGKTYLAVASAVEAMEQERVRRIVLVRPAVEAGERLGFLPGDLAQKVDPYLRPMYDALYEMLGFDRVARLVERNVIEVAPLAYMRGRSLNESFIILDEAQNTSVEQMKMFLTRMGFGSRAVVTGDITQVDLPRRQVSGLRHVMQVLRGRAGRELHVLFAERRGSSRARAADRRGLRIKRGGGSRARARGRLAGACTRKWHEKKCPGKWQGPRVRPRRRAASRSRSRRVRPLFLAAPTLHGGCAAAGGRGAVTVRLVGWPESRRLNERFRGRDGPTNVLAFPAGRAPAGPAALGDLVICLPLVHREAREQGKRSLQHLAHLVVHGTLHLLGHDSRPGGSRP